MHIGSVTADDKPEGCQYIDSSNYTKWQREGYEEFDTLEEAADIYTAAKDLFDENNPDRIDVPRYSITVEYVNRGDDICLGDIVTVNDRENNIKSKQRVIAIETHPFEPEKNTVEVGNPNVSLQNIFNGLVDARVEYKRTINSKGETKTNWLEFMQGNESVTINKALKDEDIAVLKTGMLYEAEDGSGAVAIIKGRLAVANERDDTSGQWKWTSVMDGGKVIVGKVYTGKLYSDLVEILSNDGTLNISGNLITMYDGKNKLRFKSGYDSDSEKYVFGLYDSDGKDTVKITDEGNVRICGEFANGRSGSPHMVIDANGLISYDSKGKLDGFCANRNEYAEGGVHAITLYEHGDELFSVYRNSLGVQISLLGNAVFQYSEDIGMTALGTWNVSQTHNHGIPNGTKLKTSGDGTVEWTASNPFA